jgi:hypothetical protein
MDDTTYFTWIVKNPVKLAELKGLLIGLEQQNAIEGAEVRIIAVGAGEGVHLPAGMDIAGMPVPSGNVRGELIPDGGMLVQGRLGQ